MLISLLLLIESYEPVISASFGSLSTEGYTGSSTKFEQLLQILEESRLSGRRVLIFSQFTKMLELIGRELTNQGSSYFYLDGQTPSEERVELCNRFNEGERNVFLISLKELAIELFCLDCECYYSHLRK